MRTAGLPVEVLIKYYGLVQQGDATMEERKAILVEQRAEITARMDELQQTLDLLDYKIGFYENALVEKEQELLEFHAA
jgi:DNA-binding transcriptional MerR regulator